MLILREKAPSVHKGSADEIIFEAGRAQGYRDCLDQISEVIGVESKKDIDISND